MKNGQTGKTRQILAVVFVIVCLFLLLFPVPSVVNANEFYDCVWSDGSKTQESYYSAYRSLDGMCDDGVRLVRDGKTGIISSEAMEIYKILRDGSLAELLSVKTKGTRIDRAALFRTFKTTVWYSDGYFIYTGTRVKEVKSATGDICICLNGSVPTAQLKKMGVRTLQLRGDSTVTSQAIGESQITSLVVNPPYFAEGGALYLDTAGGRRLVGALSGITELTVNEDCDFIDEGALTYCRQLRSICVPFVGNMRKKSSYFQAEFAYLFLEKGEYNVPETLKYVRVTGGLIDSYAFYACPYIEEINACGVGEADIESTAFNGMKSLRVLHTPRKDVTLTGEFTCEIASCGCAVYRRVSL